MVDKFLSKLKTTTNQTSIESGTCHHFYIYDRAKDEETSDYVYGKFQLQFTGLAKRRFRKNKDQFMESIREAVASLPAQRSGILFYIHGYQADNRFFVRISGKVLQKEMLDDPAHPYGLAISLQWSAPIAYKEAVNMARFKGNDFAELAHEVTNLVHEVYPEAPVSILCHSMGNRVWQGMYDKWVALEPKLSLDKVFMCAADLENDVFNHAFEGMSRRSKKVIIYHHRYDKTLRVAMTLSPKVRLGITGPAHSEKLPENILVRDVTGIDDDETFAGKVTNHRYYYGSPIVRGEITRLLG